jgi:hypothetical protein
MPASRPSIAGITSTTPVAADIDEAQELGAGARVLAEAAEHLEVTMLTPRLWMPRVVMHSCAPSTTTPTPQRLQHVLDALGDLRGHLLLHLEAARVGLDHARQLADADHLAVGQVADVDLADDRRHVVLAMAFVLDVAQHDHLVVAGDFLEGARQVLARIQR